MTNRFPTAEEARKLVKGNVENFNTLEINHIKEKILKAISNNYTNVKIEINSYREIKKTTSDFLKEYGYSFGYIYRDMIDGTSCPRRKWLIISW